MAVEVGTGAVVAHGCARIGVTSRDLAFQPWPDAQGQWISRRTVEPLTVQPVGDLLTLHASSAIELRITPSLWPLRDLAQAGPWSFSIVRIRNAASRP